MPMKQTHTFSILDISKTAYDEIKHRLIDAGYGHAIMKEGDGEVIDMHGIAIQSEVLELVDPKNVRQHCGHHAENLYRDEKNDLRCRVCGQLR